MQNGESFKKSKQNRAIYEGHVGGVGGGLGLSLSITIRPSRMSRAVSIGCFHQCIFLTKAWSSLSFSTVALPAEVAEATHLQQPLCCPEICTVLTNVRAHKVCSVHFVFYCKIVLCALICSCSIAQITEQNNCNFLSPCCTLNYVVQQ